MNSLLKVYGECAVATPDGKCERRRRRFNNYNEVDSKFTLDRIFFLTFACFDLLLQILITH